MQFQAWCYALSNSSAETDAWFVPRLQGVRLQALEREDDGRIESAAMIGGICTDTCVHWLDGCQCNQLPSQ